MAAQAERNQPVEDYWAEHFVGTKYALCTLCGNRGIIDTRGRAISPAGQEAGKLNYCICPNGQCGRVQDPNDEKIAEKHEHYEKVQRLRQGG